MLFTVLTLNTYLQIKEAIIKATFQCIRISFWFTISGQSVAKVTIHNSAMTSL